MTLHLLIPCRSLKTGKSRLSNCLSPAARHTLSDYFLRRTLDQALALSDPTHCHLITNDREAAAIAASRGIGSFADPGIGLNAALGSARKVLASDTRSPPELLVLPIDLPRSTPELLGRLVRSHADVAIAPDRARAGTNVLYLSKAASPGFEFRFGSDSLSAHAQIARRMELVLDIIGHENLALDVDSMEDLLEWSRRAPEDPIPALLSGLPGAT